MPYRSNQRYKVTVPRRSGFDKSFRNTGTGKCGTLIPILCDEVIPGTKARLKLNLTAQLPPLVSDTYMNVKLKAEAFFVPMRLCCGSFEGWFCDFPQRVLTSSSALSTFSFQDIDCVLPTMAISSSSSGGTPSSFYGLGSLLDYLGVRGSFIGGVNPSNLVINPLPIVAYHLVWQEFYRNPRVQNPAFAKHIGSFANVSSYVSSSQFVSAIPSTWFHRGAVNSEGQPAVDNSSFGVITDDIRFKCADGVHFLSLRQRNFGLDYFTGARVTPQQGDAVSVSFDVGDDTGSMTIAALRAANSLQQFRERNNLPSPRLVDQVKARYGASLSDGVAQRPICIGSATYDLSSTGVNQTAANPSDVGSGVNPFNSVASQYGRAYGAGSDFIIEDFVANEPGYILVNLSLVPEVTYSRGIDRKFLRYRDSGSIVEMACGLLQNVGDQPIMVSEVSGNVPSLVEPDAIFAYTDRFADFMYIPNQAHGQMRQSGTLYSYVLQRDFSGVEFGSDFLEIPVGYLDSIFAYEDDLTGDLGFSYWYDCLLDYKVSMPLQEYSIPSLQDPAYEHGEVVNLRRNGQIF